MNEEERDLNVFRKIIKSCYEDCSMDRILNNECVDCILEKTGSCIYNSILKKGWKKFMGMSGFNEE